MHGHRKYLLKVGKTFATQKTQIRDSDWRSVGSLLYILHIVSILLTICADCSTGITSRSLTVYVSHFRTALVPNFAARIVKLTAS